MALEITNVFEVKKSKSKEEFLRDALTVLAHSKNTPIDIMDCSFGKVEEYYDEITCVTFEGKVEFRGDLVTYEDVEVYNPRTQQYDKKVEKRYHPFKGVQSVSIDIFDDNYTETGLSLDAWLYSSLSSIPKEDIKRVNRVVIPNTSLSVMKIKADVDAEFKVTWPYGSHHENETYAPDLHVSNSESFTVPCYKVKLHYNGRSYWVIGFAFGKASINFQTIESSEKGFKEKDIKEAAKERRHLIENKNRKLIIAFMIVGGIFAFLSLSLLAAFPSTASSGGNIVGPIIMLIVFALLGFLGLFPSIVTKKKKKKVIQSITVEEEQLIKGFEQIKHNSLLKTLKEKGLGREGDLTPGDERYTLEDYYQFLNISTPLFGEDKIGIKYVFIPILSKLKRSTSPKEVNNQTNESETVANSDNDGHTKVQPLLIEEPEDEPSIPSNEDVSVPEELTEQELVGETVEEPQEEAQEVEEHVNNEEESNVEIVETDKRKNNQDSVKKFDIKQLIRKVLYYFSIVVASVEIIMFILGLMFLLLYDDVAYTNYGHDYYTFFGALKTGEPLLIVLLILMGLFFVGSIVNLVLTISQKKSKSVRFLIASLCFAFCLPMTLICWLSYGYDEQATLDFSNIPMLLAGIMFSVSLGFSLASAIVSLFTSQGKLKKSVAIISLIAVVSLVNLLFVPIFLRNRDVQEGEYQLVNVDYNHAPEGGQIVNGTYIYKRANTANGYSFEKYNMFTNPESISNIHGADIACYLKMNFNYGDSFFIEILIDNYTYRLDYYSLDTNPTSSNAGLYSFKSTNGKIYCIDSGNYNIYINYSRELWVGYCN